MKKISTFSKAYEACETFFLESGQMPTIEAIRPMIGVNSPSIISSAIKSWKNDLSQNVRSQQGLDPGTPKALMDAVTELWALALTEAKESIKDKISKLDAKQLELDQLTEDLKKESDQIGQLVKMTEQKYQEEATYLKKENERLAAETASALAQLESYRTTVSAVEMKNAVLSEAIRQEKEKYQKLDIQYEREHEWSFKRIEEEKENHRRETAQDMYRLQSEATRNKQAAEIAQTKLGQLSQQLNEYRDKVSLLETNLAEEKLKLAGLTLDKANLQSEINVLQERIRKLTTKVKKSTIQK
jgi:chromosome segregation ATPase